MYRTTELRPIPDQPLRVHLWRRWSFWRHLLCALSGKHDWEQLSYAEMISYKEQTGPVWYGGFEYGVFLYEEPRSLKALQEIGQRYDMSVHCFICRKCSSTINGFHTPSCDPYGYFG